MSDKMRLIPIGTLLDWTVQEWQEKQTLFGVRKLYKADPGKKLNIFGETIETPLGPAAGPQTQLAQNLIAAYVTGSRFFEVKTVQVIDGEDLPVEKPCIDARDECFNCEWSTELYVPQALEEYVKAWFVNKILAKEYDLGDPDGFVFNMSVGYDLAGIKTEKINNYLEGMRDASALPIWQECVEEALKRVDTYENVDEAYIRSISPKVSRSVTISTLHGCPPDEIERIANYLIEEKGFHTFIKCNPTILGYETARKIADENGFDYLSFDDHHFKEDLQFSDAIPMFKRLLKLTGEKGLAFGVKITNTFPVDNNAPVLPGEEMYMSGRSLFPLSVEAAKKISEAMDGKLRISYSGGADAFNIDKLFGCQIWPITIATYMLKPGGYQRMSQLAETVTKMPYSDFDSIDLKKLDELSVFSKSDRHYKKPLKPQPKRKNNDQVPLTNCFIAPCRGGCPIEQDIPAYLRYVEEGKNVEALEVIVERNPLPFLTGTLCNHRCMDRCTRAFYEESVHIRNAKLTAAKGAYDEIYAGLKASMKNGAPKTAIVGGGPAGIALAHFLAREGYPVTVFERLEKAGGVPRNVIPSFRIADELIQKDVDMAIKLGADIRTGTEAPSLEELKAQGYDNVVYATGAWNPGRLPLEEGEATNAYVFLRDVHQNPDQNNYGKKIAVIGAGNTAMDCARAAVRLPGVEEVSIVYRRDIRNMPADEEELREALEDGVVFRPLFAPESFKDGVLHCKAMKLGEPDASGRRAPVATGGCEDYHFDHVIAAVGEQVDVELLNAAGIKTDERGRCQTNAETLESGNKNVFVIGDAKRGPATIVEAIADAQKVAAAITSQAYDKFEDVNQNESFSIPRAKHGRIIMEEPPIGPGACLECSTICESCVDVCPNRANVSIEVAGQPQILHVDGMCNECGNCETFCPWASAPYKDKFTIFNAEADFADSENDGFYAIDTNNVKLRLTGNVTQVDLNNAKGVDEILVGMMRTVIDKYPYFLY